MKESEKGNILSKTNRRAQQTRNWIFKRHGKRIVKRIQYETTYGYTRKIGWAFVDGQEVKVIYHSRDIWIVH